MAAERPLDRPTVFASGIGGIGVEAYGSTVAVVAQTNEPTGIAIEASAVGVAVNASAVDVAVLATSTGQTGIGVDAFGVHHGLRGESTAGVGAVGQSAKGVGVRGVSEMGTGVVGTSEAGVGGDFSGGAAPIRLRPAEGTDGPPVGGRHQVGELYVDGNGELYFCSKPGVWRRVVMAPDAREEQLT
jgi:hypothetical protein